MPTFHSRINTCPTACAAITPYSRRPGMAASRQVIASVAPETATAPYMERFLLPQRGVDGSDEMAHGKQRRQWRACAKQRCQLRRTVDGIGQNRRGQIDQSRAAQRYRQAGAETGQNQPFQLTGIVLRLGDAGKRHHGKCAGKDAGQHEKGHYHAVEHAQACGGFRRGQPLA